MTLCKLSVHIHEGVGGKALGRRVPCLVTTSLGPSHHEYLTTVSTHIYRTTQGQTANPGLIRKFTEQLSLTSLLTVQYTYKWHISLMLGCCSLNYSGVLSWQHYTLSYIQLILLVWLSPNLTLIQTIYIYIPSCIHLTCLLNTYWYMVAWLHSNQNSSWDYGGVTKQPLCISYCITQLTR